MTRVVILAAGFGSRLMPLTADRPKGMVPLAGIPLLARQIAVLRSMGITDISIVGGYLAQRLETLRLPVVPNPAYDTTNMVESLMTARALLDGQQDVIMAYGDIVYEPRVVEALLQQEGDAVVVADRGWQRLWSARMEDYSSDVETFRIGPDGCVVELGKRPRHLDEVEAQYIGLVKFPARSHGKLLAFYDGLDRLATYDGQPFQKMYMTSFLQQLIDADWKIRPALIDNGWLEVDTLEDLQRYEAMGAGQNLSHICRLQDPAAPAELLAQLVRRGDEMPTGLCDINAVAARLLDIGEPTHETTELLDRLARKIEISGVLHRSYTFPEMKPVVDSVATAEEAAALLTAYILAFDRTGDRRHLNTVLKALGGVLRQPALACFHEIDYFCAYRLGEHVR